MALEYEPDTRVAHWLVESGTPDGQLILFGPKSYEAYARIRFIPDPAGPGQEEADVPLPPDHKPDLWQTQRVIHRLARFTTAENGYFGVWEGYSNIPLPTYDGLFELPHRRYAIFKGPLSAIDDWSVELGSGQPIAPPAFVWPVDRAWCFASDVDPHWAGVGATREAVKMLIRDEDIDAVEAIPEQRQPQYR
ncbi:hypothetical protein [Amycolatopsis sp. NPDC050768]|uniref:hypothetical protein n=1 Tax=Amycolatopsis sp. NPDC050768 TaxID=3154839 RepID=UPI0033D2D566